MPAEPPPIRVTVCIVRMIVWPQRLLDALGATIARAARTFKEAVAQLAKVVAAAFPSLRTIRFPRAHHPIAQGASPKQKRHPSKGGSEISAGARQRPGVPKLRRVAPAPPADRLG